MKYPSVASLLALCAASRVLALGVHEAAVAAHIEERALSEPHDQQPALGQSEDQQPEDLKVRRGVAAGGGANLGISLSPSQYPSVTTQWVESTIAGTTTYVEVIYTQTFAAVPDQWPMPGQGVIGYGTLTEDSTPTTTSTGAAKRDLQARETGLGIAGRIWA
ncbi:hypothetical protein EJ03DRAFT_337415 [Teratosphaeria nubilosa]|uniref:Uncharacterized protein n=1 Tax=Teratosphaeria nubilosa TaxID=161662 RepID=A0A6G1L5I4_9PEZI|nr:hypothetical protein EJ03DRAFT_337415 [Teratosphaeria nubilosa]